MRKVIIARPRVENGRFMLKIPNSQCFGRKVFRGEGCRVYDFLLIGCWGGNRAVLQAPCV